MSADSPSRFKSRFSLLSLLPPRHPPLKPAPSVPPVPTLPRLSQLPPRPLDAIHSLSIHSLNSNSNSSSSHLLPSNRHVDAPKRPILVSRNSALSTAHSEYPDSASPQKESPPLLPPISTYPVPPRRPQRPGDSVRRRPVQKLDSEEDEQPVIIEGPVKASPSPPRRPPPLDLAKTREAYPGVKGVMACVPTPEPAAAASTKRTESRRGGWFGVTSPQKSQIAANPVATPEKPKKAEKTTAKPGDDPFEVCEIEPGHKYASWKQARVSIRPGQIVPQGTFAELTPTIRGLHTDKNGNVAGGSSSFHLQPPPRGHRQPIGSEENYDSVLHNVLLSPAYLDPSPNTEYAPSSSREERRRTLLNRVGDVVRDTGKWAGKSILKNRNEDTAGQAVRDMREREMRELARFRHATRPYPLRSNDELVLPPVRQVIYISGSSGRDYEHHHHSSPGSSERHVGLKYERRYKNQDREDSDGKGSMWCCFKRKKKEESMKKKMYKVSDNQRVSMLC